MLFFEDIVCLGEFLYVEEVFVVLFVGEVIYFYFFLIIYGVCELGIREVECFENFY